MRWASCSISGPISSDSASGSADLRKRRRAPSPRGGGEGHLEIQEEVHQAIAFEPRAKSGSQADEAASRACRSASGPRAGGLGASVGKIGGLGQVELVDRDFLHTRAASAR
jgi:hypothetical protein